MADHQHDAEQHDSRPGRWVFWGFLAVAAFFLIMEHSAHVVQYLPYVLLAACPLMHLFHGHGGHSGTRSEDKSKLTTGGEHKHECH